MNKLLFTILFGSFIINSCYSNSDSLKVKTGAENISEYISKIQNKNVGVVANQSSLIGSTHLVDTLLKSGIEITKIFSPEHGFRGKGDRGELIDNSTDSKTGIPLISLYGKNNKPTDQQLEGIDIMLFDLQDVGVRYFTYISTLHYILEAVSENNIPLIILDRPNPNGFYIDGPVLDMNYQSFVGMYPVPVVHGMTIGEMALMALGENWVCKQNKPDITIIKCTNYIHNTRYQLPVKPSPNLPDMKSIYLYPSVCLFEGTIVSLGRGTPHPFQMYGHPDFTEYDTVFIPESIEGASKNPLLKNQKCFGINLRNLQENEMCTFTLKYIIHAYNQLKNNHEFFTSYFTLLAGTAKLEEAVKSGMNSDEIRLLWQNDLDNYKKTRKKYLLYTDFTH